MLIDNTTNIVAHLEEMKKYFDSQATKSYSFRKEQLLLLRKNILKYENDLYEALFSDLKKNKEEVWITETGFVLTEISYALKHLKKWMRPEKTSTNLLNFPSSSYVLKEPLGIVLIISPWNYPFQLLFTPLIGAIAAGNCAVLKPSEFAPATAAVMRSLINETFSKQYIAFMEGEGAQIVPEMMNNFTFNHIFYTGSTHTGKLIYKMAADKLVPATLELGGKSPCIIEQDADVKIAVRRIATTKFSNAGQMCVAPDYILIHESIREKFIAMLSEYITAFYSKNPADNDGYGKIINEKQFTRLVAYLNNGTIVHGGRHDISKTIY